MALSLRYLTHSETGLVRKNNQDSGYASPFLLVVADGMGGAAAGDLASALAVDAVRRVDAPSTAEVARGDQMLEVLAGALHQANDRIADLIDDNGALDGMGTTLTGALFDGHELGLAHIGDSRAYLLRDGHLERLTHDHSWVQSLVDDGKISEDEAALHPHRSLLLRVLNGQPASDPDLSRVPLQAGDRLLFCSDGLCGLVEDPDIAAALRLPDPDDALAALIIAAHAEGGIDNITLIVADVVEGESAPAAPVVFGAAQDRELPLASAATAGQDTEDLPPVVDDADEPVRPAAVAREDHEDEARYSPRAPHRRRLLRPLVGTLALLLLAVAGLGAGYAWTRTQFYVGASEESVAIFQGVAETVPGVNLSRVYEVQSLAVTTLPPYYQDRVRAGIAVSGLDAARSTVVELTAAAQRCARAVPPASARTAAPSLPVPSVSAPSVTPPSPSMASVPAPGPRVPLTATPREPAPGTPAVPAGSASATAGVALSPRATATLPPGAEREC